MSRARFFVLLGIASLLCGSFALAAPKEKGGKKGKAKSKGGAEGELPEGVTKPSETANYDEIADGSRLILRDGEISIIPPKGWEIFKKQSGLTLLAQAPLKATTKYQRTLQASRLGGPRYLDQFSSSDARKLIAERFGKVSRLVTDYNVLSDELITLGNGRPAMLIKASFKYGEIPLMQAHVIVSSLYFHYVVSFTDTPANFGGEDKIGKNLLEAMASIKTVEMKGEHPVRMGNILAVSVGGGTLLFLGLGFLIFRFFRAAKRFEEMSEGKNLDLTDSEERHDLVEANHDERVRVEVHQEESTIIAKTGLLESDADEVTAFDAEPPVTPDEKAS